MYNAADRVYIQQHQQQCRPLQPWNTKVVPVEFRDSILTRTELEDLTMLLHDSRSTLRRSRSAPCAARSKRLQWIDGRMTAGPQSGRVPNRTASSPRIRAVARQLGELILGALQRSPLFMSAALPLKVYPPLFNRYSGGTIVWHPCR